MKTRLFFLEVGLTIFSMLVLSSCGFKNAGDSCNVSFAFISRSANYIWADHLYLQKVEVKNLPEKHFYIIEPLMEATSVKASDYILSFNTCNRNVQEVDDAIKAEGNYVSLFMSNAYNPTTRAPFLALGVAQKEASDPIIEKNIQKSLTSQCTSPSGLSANLRFVTYTTSPIKNIKISSSAPLLGYAAGASINDLFLVHKLHEHFIVSADKSVITGPITQIDLKRYLSYNPLAPAFMGLSFKPTVKLTQEVTTTFTVELTLEGGKIITATTKPITLLP